MLKTLRMRLLLLLPMLMAMLGVTSAMIPEAHAAPTGGVLILDSTVTGGASSYEAQAATSLGLAVTVVNGTTWDSMTTAQFATYQALILGDPQCSYPGNTSPLNAAMNNLTTWGKAVKLGGQVLIGTDPSFHTSVGIAGAYKLITAGIKFATGNPNSTGVYISLSCYYYTAAPGTAVPVLNALNPGFTVEGQDGVCPDNAHFLNKPPAFKTMTDSDIQGWGCSIHEQFDTFPSKFTKVAENMDNGLPYILVHRTNQ